MITANDSLFCIVNACDKGLRLNKLSYYMYICQLAGYDFSFNFKITSSGVQSKNLIKYIEQLENEDYIVQDDNMLRNTKKGYDYLESIILSLDEIEFADWLMRITYKLDVEDLRLLVITNIVLEEYMGKEMLETSKKKIMDTVSVLCPSFTDKEFYSAINLIQRIKEKNYE